MRAHRETRRASCGNTNGAADIDDVIGVIDRYRKPLDQRDREDQVIRQE